MPIIATPPTWSSALTLPCVAFANSTSTSACKLPPEQFSIYYFPAIVDCLVTRLGCNPEEAVDVASDFIDYLKSPYIKGKNRGTKRLREIRRRCQSMNGAFRGFLFRELKSHLGFYRRNVSIAGRISASRSETIQSSGALFASTQAMMMEIINDINIRNNGNDIDLDEATRTIQAIYVNGYTQTRLAYAEKVSQSAIAQRLSKSQDCLIDWLCLNTKNGSRLSREEVSELKNALHKTIGRLTKVSRQHFAVIASQLYFDSERVMRIYRDKQTKNNRIQEEDDISDE